MEAATPIRMWLDKPIYQDTCMLCFERGMRDPRGGVNCSECGELTPVHDIVIEASSFVAACACGWRREGLSAEEAHAVAGEHEDMTFWDAVFHGEDTSDG